MGTRKVQVHDFIQGAMSPGLETGEILTCIEMEAWPRGHGYAFLEHAKRTGDFAISSAACLMTFDARGVVSRASICIGGLGDRPLRLNGAETKLIGKKPGLHLFAQLAEEVSGLPAEGSIHASVSFKRQIARTLLQRALILASARAGFAMVTP